MTIPCPGIATKAVNFIAQQEVSNRANYDAVVAKPTCPGGDSGITIGVGYDLRFETADFEADWGPYCRRRRWPGCGLV